MRRCLLLTVWLSICAAPAYAPAAVPDLNDFRVDNLPIFGHDAPVISNNWLWARADAGVLNLRNVRCGVREPFDGTIEVKVNGDVATTEPRVATWWPNKLVRRKSSDPIECEGVVVAAANQYALLNILRVTNRSARPQTVQVTLTIAKQNGLHASVETPDHRCEDETSVTLDFESVKLGSGQVRTIRCVNLYRSDARRLKTLLEDFDGHVKAAKDYWDTLLKDAYTPGAGPYLGGSVPDLHTEDRAVKKFYDVRAMTLLMTLKRDLDKGMGPNMYVDGMAQSAYCPTLYLWNIGYASDLLAMLDPDSLRTILQRSAYFGVNTHLNMPYNGWDGIDLSRDSGTATGYGWNMFAAGRFYSANSSSFFAAVWNYINFTGDYEWLNSRVKGKTMLRWLHEIAHWYKTREEWNGLAHYGEEGNLFDDITIPGYHSWVAAPNAADVWMNRRLADIYAQLYDDPDTARELRAEATRIAAALNKHLYNHAGEHAGTWKQRHADGTMLQLRHLWDFALTGSFMSEYLSAEQAQQMRDWFMNQCVRVDSDDVWIVAQDPRDLNAGPHQREHNGSGAYPAWPYHAGWALHAMGFHQDVVDLLHVIDGVVAFGAIGQGFFPNGRRCRSNWAKIEGGNAAAYVIRNVFDIEPELGPFETSPQLGNLDPGAWLEGVPVKGRLYNATKDGVRLASE